MVIRSIHAIGSPGMGGAERFFARLVRGLVRAGSPATAVVRRGAALKGHLDGNVRVVETGMRNGIDVFTMLRVRRLIRTERPHIVQTYLGRASRLTRVPADLGSVHVARLGGYYRMNSYRHAHAWIGNTRGLCDYLVRQGCPADRVFHISNFVDRPREDAGLPDVAALRRELALPDDAFVVFGLGRLIERKGFDILLDAVTRLPDRIDGRPLVLAIAGDGPMLPALESAGRRALNRDRLRLPGWVADPDMWYRASDVFVCPSREEPLGNVILEAWSHGLPVVATRTAGPLELITEGHDGLLVEAGDAKQLADALLRLLRGAEDERLLLGRNGRARVAADHAEDVIVRAYMNLYEDLVARPAPG